MKKFLILLVVVCYCTFSGWSQDMTKFKLYKPEENASAEISRAVKKAKETGKHVFIQIGGNWCIWCARFNDFVTHDKRIDSLINENYVTYHMNYSPENKNTELLKKFQFPQRFGFPVFLVLNGDGQLIHTQNSAYLEEGKGYSRDKVIEFFEQWTRKAIDPDQYKNQ